MPFVFAKLYLTSIIMSIPKKRKRSMEQDPALSSSSAAQDQSSVQATEPKRKRVDQKRSLFVYSIPSSATNESLIAHFSQSFPVKHGTAVLDSKTKSCKGYGFVTFADAEDAARAREEFNGSEFDGRKIKIDIAEPRHRDVDDTLPGSIKQKSISQGPAPQAKNARAKAEESKSQQSPRLIIRNLPWSIKTPEQLSRLFESYGKVKEAKVPNQKPGLLSGFGFITLRGHKNAQKAIDGVNGTQVDGRVLAVDYAVDRETWQAQQMKEQQELNEGGQESDHAEQQEDDRAERDDLRSASGASSQFSDADDEDLEEQDYPHQEQSRSYDSTLFVRNVPFTAIDEALFHHFTPFGSVRYARIVMDPSTEKPKGTAFVCFYRNEDAINCLKRAPRPQADRDSTSVLQNDEADPTGEYTLDGRVLQVSKAVDRSEAARLSESHGSKQDDTSKDKRRLFLLSEGTLTPGSSLYQSLPPSEVKMREESVKQRKKLIQSNPSLHMSLTRLSIRNVPRSVSSKELKNLARQAVVKFATEVKEEKRQGLSKEELKRSVDSMREADKSRKLKKAGIVKQAKIEFESKDGSKTEESSGAGRSRGYGFIEYYTHRNALMGLRWLNGHPLEYDVQIESDRKSTGTVSKQKKKKRLIAEFAIDNAQVVSRRMEREKKARGQGPRTVDPVAGRNEAKAAVSGRGSSPLRDSKKADSQARASKTTPEAAGDQSKSKHAGRKAKKQHTSRIINRKRALRRGKKQDLRRS